MDTLSPREAEVLRLLATGLTNREIADRLGLSPRSVQKHLEHVYRKLGVRTRTAAATALVRGELADVLPRVSQ